MFSTVHLRVQFDFVTGDRLPLLCCLIAFILTFFLTRLIVRYIRSHPAGDAPRKWWQPRNLSVGGGVHLHVLAALPNTLYMESGLLPEDGSIELANGCYPLPEAPGFGK